VTVALSIDTVKAGDELPRREHTPTNVSLFLYNAAVWNAHRIHYDAPYTTEVERHPGIVVDGPLQGDWLTQVALNWLGEDGTLTRFSYSNRRASYLGETLTSGGRVVSVDPSNRTIELELFITNESGEVITPGAATVVLAD
jgi:hydroxyacyl-ACP dehydratase HTD2-like protein with hotdog domain